MLQGKDSKILNADIAIDRLGGDEELWKEILEMCMQDTPIYYNALCKAIEEQDISEAFNRAHALKSMVANVGAENARTYAERLELACREQRTQNLEDLREQLGNSLKELREYICRQKLI